MAISSCYKHRHCSQVEVRQTFENLSVLLLDFVLHQSNQEPWGLEVLWSSDSSSLMVIKACIDFFLSTENNENPPAPRIIILFITDVLLSMVPTDEPVSVLPVN